MTFHSAGNVIIPIDFHSIIFQRGRAQPPTSDLLNSDGLILIYQDLHKNQGFSVPGGDLRGKILPGCLAPTATRVARRCELLSGGPFGFTFSHSNGDFLGMVWDGVDGWIIYHMENHRKMVI